MHSKYIRIIRLPDPKNKNKCCFRGDYFFGFRKEDHTATQMLGIIGMEGATSNESQAVWLFFLMLMVCAATAILGMCCLFGCSVVRAQCDANRGVGMCEV